MRGPKAEPQRLGLWGNGWEVPTRQWARLRDSSRTPAGFRPNGLPLGQQSRCRLGTFEPAQSKGGWTTHPERQNPSRMQAQRVAIGSAEPVPFGHLRTRSKQRWMDGAGRCGLGEFSIRWARIRNSRTPAGFRPNGLPLGQQSRCRLGTFEPAKSKGGWMGLDARIRNGRTPAGCRPNGLPLGQQNRCRLGTVDGWGWTLWPG